MLFELHRVEIANADQLEMALGRGSNQRLKQRTHGVRCPLCQTAQRTALRHKTSPHVPCVFVLLIIISNMYHTSEQCRRTVSGEKLPATIAIKHQIRMLMAQEIKKAELEATPKKTGTENPKEETT